MCFSEEARRMVAKRDDGGIRYVVVKYNIGFDASAQARSYETALRDVAT
jgi:hypothetical protein